MTTQPFTNHARDWVAWFLVTAILVVFTAIFTLSVKRADVDLAYDAGFSDGVEHGVEQGLRSGTEATARIEEPQITEETVLELLWLAETDGRLDPPDGDGGASIGPFHAM